MERKENKDGGGEIEKRRAQIRDVKDKEKKRIKMEDV